MQKYRSRFIVAITALIAVVLTAFGFFLGQLIIEFYHQTVSNQLMRDTQLVKQLVIKEGLNSPSLLDEVNQTSRKLGVWITVFNDHDQVLANSNGDVYIKSPNVNFTFKNDQPMMKQSIEEPVYYYSVSIKKAGEKVGSVRISISDERIKQVERKIIGSVSACLFVAFLLIFIISFKITSQLIKPIEDVTRVSKELAKGNFKARTYDNQIDETSELSHSINILAQNLQKMTKSYEVQQERLETLIENMGSGLILIDDKGYIGLINRSCKEMLNVKIEQWIHRLYYEAISHEEVISIIEEIFMTEKKVQKQLLLPLEIERRHFDVYGAPILGVGDILKGIVLVFHDITDLKNLEQTRKDFVANVSHELKTPITSIRGFTETLLDGAMEEKALRERFLRIILQESERLQNLIQDLLDLSKIEQEYFTLNWEPVDLNAVTKDVLLILQYKAEEKEIKLRHSTHGNTTVLADSFRIKQILINIINNSLTYTPKGGNVHVYIQEQKDHVQLIVSDTGIGMSKEEIPRIFERFYRIDKARSRNSGGTGLGLAIVKHLVEAHHGKITVDSEKDKGSTFTITFLKEPPTD